MEIVSNTETRQKNFRLFDIFVRVRYCREKNTFTNAQTSGRINNIFLRVW